MSRICAGFALPLLPVHEEKVLEGRIRGGADIKAIAPSEEAKNKFWDQIKLVNPNADDITAEISVDTSRSMGAAAGGGAGQGGQTYTVKAGDTLSKISKEFYKDANEYMRIFYANRSTLKDPDKIQVGQQLTIPPDDNA